MRKIVAVFSLLFFASPAIAGNLSVRVVDQSGRPVNDAVVTIDPIGRPAQPARAARTISHQQHRMMFHPFVSVVPVGATVDFPNLDATRHHVYSFSPAKRFDLKLFARDQTRSIRVEKAGVIAIGCNIHDQMSAFLFVSATRWAQPTERGATRFGEAPSGLAKITVWHPYMRTPTHTLSRTLRLGDGDHLESFTVKLRPAPRHDMDNY